MCGIYKITNLINGKAYIGQSINIENRWHEHKYADNKPSIIHSAIKKYGKENFKFEVLEECAIEQLDDKEIYWIKYYNTYYEGYNATFGGQFKQIKNDYEKIYNLWLEGYPCKEIQRKLKIDDVGVTNALRYYNISESEAKSRAQKKKKIVAIDIDSGEPLKIFESQNDMTSFFGKNIGTQPIKLSIEKHYRVYGYYWEYLSDNNYPKYELTNEEFLLHQKAPLKIYTEEQKLNMSLKQRKVERPSRAELKKLIRSTSFTAIGKEYGVSDNAIRKWCDQYNLPRRVRDIKFYSDEEWDKL